MAFRADATADSAYRTASTPAFGSFTEILWANRKVDKGAGEYLFIFGSASLAGYWALAVDGLTTDKVAIETTLGGGLGATSSGSAWSVGTWKRLAIVFDDTADTLTLFEDGSQTAQVTGATGTFTTAELYHAVPSAGSEFDGLITASKLYTTTLTLAQIENEWRQFLPASTTNLWGWWPLLSHTDLSDYSGNGRPLTANGTLTTEDGPPIAWSASPRRRWYQLTAPPASTLLHRMLTLDVGL